MANSSNTEEPESLLSDRLLAFIDSEDSLWGIEERANFEKLIRAAANTLEGFGETWAEKLHAIWKEDPAFYRWAVGDWYGREAVHEIHGIVRRFLRLSPVLVKRTPNCEVNVYLREATRCFLYGFFQGSVALSRAALEHGLNERLSNRLGAVPNLPLKENRQGPFVQAHLSRRGGLGNPCRARWRSCAPCQVND